MLPFHVYELYAALGGAKFEDHPSSGVSLALLLQASLWGARIGEKHWLVVRHPVKHPGFIDGVTTPFDRILGSHVSSGEDKPAKTCVLRMGAETNDGEDIFARFEFNPDKLLDDGTITFSPVPFGEDGRPELPDSEDLLEAASLVLTTEPYSVDGWTKDHFAVRFSSTYSRSPKRDPADILNELDMLGVMGYNPDGPVKFAPAMTAQQFEDIFGVNLPSAACQTLFTPRNGKPVGLEEAKPEDHCVADWDESAWPLCIPPNREFVERYFSDVHIPPGKMMLLCKNPTLCMLNKGTEQKPEFWVVGLKVGSGRKKG